MFNTKKMDKRLVLYYSNTKVKRPGTKNNKKKGKGIIIVHVPKKFVGYTANIVIYSKRQY